MKNHNRKNNDIDENIEMKLDEQPNIDLSDFKEEVPEINSVFSYQDFKEKFEELVEQYNIDRMAVKDFIFGDTLLSIAEKKHSSCHTLVDQGITNIERVYDMIHRDLTVTAENDPSTVLAIMCISHESTKNIMDFFESLSVQAADISDDISGWAGKSVTTNDRTISRLPNEVALQINITDLILKVFPYIKDYFKNHAEIINLTQHERTLYTFKKFSEKYATTVNKHGISLLYSNFFEESFLDIVKNAYHTSNITIPLLSNYLLPELVQIVNGYCGANATEVVDPLYIANLTSSKSTLNPDLNDVSRSVLSITAPRESASLIPGFFKSKNAARLLPNIQKANDDIQSTISIDNRELLNEHLWDELNTIINDNPERTDYYRKQSRVIKFSRQDCVENLRDIVSTMRLQNEERRTELLNSADTLANHISEFGLTENVFPLINNIRKNLTAKNASNLTFYKQKINNETDKIINSILVNIEKLTNATFNLNEMPKIRTMR